MEEDNWLEETVEEVLRREELSRKIEAFLEKSQEIIDANNQITTPVKHVRFKTTVITRVISRLPRSLWYSYQEYVEMRE